MCAFPINDVYTLLSLPIAIIFLLFSLNLSPPFLSVSLSPPTPPPSLGSLSFMNHIQPYPELLSSVSDDLAPL